MGSRPMVLEVDAQPKLGMYCKNVDLLLRGTLMVRSIGLGLATASARRWYDQAQTPPLYINHVADSVSLG